MNDRGIFTKMQLSQIEKGRRRGLTEKQIALYAKEHFNEEQMEQIRWGLEQGVPLVKMNLVAQECYDPSQMKVILWAVQADFSEDDLAAVVDPALDGDEMYEKYDTILRRRSD